MVRTILDILAVFPLANGGAADVVAANHFPGERATTLPSRKAWTDIIIYKEEKQVTYICAEQLNEALTVHC
jgi:hypothetical protein